MKAFIIGAASLVVAFNAEAGKSCRRPASEAPNFFTFSHFADSKCKEAQKSAEGVKTATEAVEKEFSRKLKDLDHPNPDLANEVKEKKVTFVDLKVRGTDQCFALASANVWFGCGE